jgi:hypothetical protein
MEALAFPVLLELTHSRRLRVFLLAAHGVALAGCLFTPWPLWGRILFLFLLAGNFLYALRSLGQRPRRLMLAADGSLRLDFSRDGAFGNAAEPLCPARPSPGALALPWLCVFSWRGEETPDSGTLVLLSDSFRTNGRDNLRRLNIWLRWGR